MGAPITITPDSAGPVTITPDAAAQPKTFTGEALEYAKQLGRNIVGLTSPAQIYEMLKSFHEAPDLESGIKAAAMQTPIPQAAQSFMGETQHAADLLKQPGVLPKVLAGVHTLGAAVPFVGQPAATGIEQVATGEPGKGLANITTAAGMLAVPEAAKEVEGGAFVKPEPVDLSGTPAKLVRGLGQTSPDPANTLATYQQALPHLADIARQNQGVHTAQTVFQGVAQKISDLGKPIDSAVSANAGMPAGGSPALDSALRERVKAEVGTPDELTKQTNPDAMRLYQIGQGTGPLTLGELDTIRRYGADQSGPYYNALNRGDQKEVSAWKEAESYARNVEYSKLRDLTGLDIDQIQNDRAALIRVQEAAMKGWARDLRQAPMNLAQSIGIPLGASRFISGALSTLAGNPGGLMQIAHGAAEVGTFEAIKEMQSSRHTLGSAMSDLAHSDLRTPDYRIQGVTNASPASVSPNASAAPAIGAPAATQAASGAQAGGGAAVPATLPAGGSEIAASGAGSEAHTGPITAPGEYGNIDRILQARSLRAAADSRKVTPAAYQDLSDMISSHGKAPTLQQVFDNSGAKMVDRLIQDGVIDPAERKGLVSGTGLTESGRYRLTAMMNAYIEAAGLNALRTAAGRF